ncbi:aminotransferase class V-fold PLP-dependent enzyme [Aerococcaceae bacterium WS4759]|uniref:Aminotransferase class V-fold PLP-dependent enzyme n=1 Tax=Fundicoccus ignavus TaxID=2664442 RepID=A0A6I2GLN1_9LACT|nr:cysteine desulfurase family protein [Fundicoccus ignavus]MRI85448.1 aminotransferase class V-fold PLP-dependent enzyme [Fundicoccus ignavus]
MFYFDNSATTQPSETVMKVVQEVAINYFANPSSIHFMGEKSKALLNSARQQVAELLDYKESEIYFTSSGTEANNWVFHAVLPALGSLHSERKKVIISSIEHPSITAQIEMIERMGYIVELAPVDEDGVLDLKSLAQLITKDVLILSTMSVNNEVGSIQPLDAIAELLKDFPQIVWHVDGIQSVTTQFENMLNKRIDLLSLSSHKFHSVRGVGILAKRQKVDSEPMLYGGGQEAGLRSSTENLPAIVATAKALRLSKESQEIVKPKLKLYREKICQSLTSQKWQVYAEQTGSEHIICAALEGVPGEVLVHALAEKSVIVSTTSACSSRKHQAHHTLKAMNIPEAISTSAIRISMSHTTTDEDVTALINAIEVVSQKFNK